MFTYSRRLGDLIFDIMSLLEMLIAMILLLSPCHSFALACRASHHWRWGRRLRQQIQNEIRDFNRLYNPAIPSLSPLKLALCVFW